jgi:hypothetical protein
MDRLERLRASVRLEWPEEVQLLVSTLTHEEEDRLRELLRGWRPERGPITRGVIRACLDRVVEER